MADFSARGRQLLASGPGTIARRLGLSPAAAASVRIPRPLEWDQFEPIDVDAGKIWMSRQDQVMRPFMQKAGTWEPDEGRLLQSIVRPGERFLDIGANVGYFSVLIGKAVPGVIIDAVEPDPDNVRALEFNLWVNGVPAQVWAVALDDTDRHLLLSSNQTNLGDLRASRVAMSSNGGGPPAAGPEEANQWAVPAASGNDLFAGRSFDVIKIDVQGWEFAVLDGLTDVLDRSPGIRIVAEFQPDILRSQHRVPTDVLASYRNSGYRVRCLMGDHLAEKTDPQIIELCDAAGRVGSVILLLER
jgi:FkbM family methyltransferase